MLQVHRRVTPSIKFAGSIHLGGERHFDRRVLFNTTECSRPGLEPRPLYVETRAHRKVSQEVNNILTNQREHYRGILAYNICLISISNSVSQDPKLTLLGRRRLATEIFFSVAGGKMWSEKSLNKIFPWQRNTKLLIARWKFWSPTFLLRIATKRTRLGPQW